MILLPEAFAGLRSRIASGSRGSFDDKENLRTNF